MPPASTKASSTAKLVLSSAVQSKTLPPNATGATSIPLLPMGRLSIGVLLGPFRSGPNLLRMRQFGHQHRVGSGDDHQIVDADRSHPRSVAADKIGMTVDHQHIA